ncbi:MAG: malonyl-CoA decarboxylase [Desulfuromonadales bacterium]|nr:malonyl-CoA decarboxylase [Desulfuromonadales bacterium]
MNSRFYLGWDHIRRAWEGILGSGGLSSLPKVDAELPPADAERVKRLMEECLAARGGEVSARQRAAALGEIYLTLSKTGRRNFLETMVDNFCVDREQVKTTARQLLETADDNSFQQLATRMRETLVSPQQKLLRQFNALPQGIKFLVDLRADLLVFLAYQPKLSTLDHDLKSLLATWFDVGFLSVQRITWQSPAALLEKLMAYEAVHAINSWTDLHNRLESDRRCYAFFHPGMSEEPLIFIEVALVEGLATSVQELLDESAPKIAVDEADTAIFYSISNTQKGLQGISFGPFLIKQVVTSLQSQLPNLKTFSTLSPLPGFRRWLIAYFEAAMAVDTRGPMEQALIEAARLLNVAADAEAVFNTPQWWQDQQVVATLKEPLLSLCAHYLHEPREKDRAPLDPVARFHLGNGARIERINWLGDTSAKGMQESCGLMVNYLYQLKEIEKNIETYATSKEIAAASRVRNLLRDDEDEQGQLARLRRLLSRGRGNSSAGPQ